ncbi:MAG: SH3 domain-containing protein [Myxococcota bacterium]|nr:SH3 domain-containing protein [Myxococcota bacterium]
MKPLLTLGALAMSLTLGVASSALAADTPLDSAQRAAAAGRHDDAARALERVVASEGYSPDVLLELGNAHARAGRTGHAVLVWERARLLAPNDADVISNLDRVRSEAGLEPPPESAIESAARTLPARHWLALGGAALVLFVLGAAAFPLLRKGRGALTLLTALSAIAVVVSSGALWVGTLATERGVLVAEGAATMRLSPFEDAEPVATLAEGEVVSIEAEHDAWVRVEDRAGQRGWLPRTVVEGLVTSAVR